MSAFFPRPSWQRDAACHEHPEVPFFLEQGQSAAPARAVCAGCLCRVECLAFAIETRTEFGVFGGLTPHQRRPMWPPAPPRDDHGNTAAYQRGCRCEECAEANRDYQRAWREARAKRAG